MNKWDAMRATALAAVVEEPFEYQLRRISRWYSKTFHTPLADVDNIPVEDLIYTYYECMYEDLPPERREEEIEDIFTPPDKRVLKLDETTERKVSDDDFMKQIQDEEKKKAEEAKKTPDMADKMEKMAQSMAGLSDAFKAAKEVLKEPEVPREISLNFKPDLSDLPDDEPDTAFGMKLKRPKKKSL